MKDLFVNLFGAIAVPLFILVNAVLFYFMFTRLGADLEPILSIIIALSPIWLPLATFFIMFDEWVNGYLEMKFWLANGRSTLRIKLPQEVFRSPEAMEGVLAQIYNPNGPDNLWQTYVDGKRPQYLSLELVSHGGEVRFYINVPTKKTKNAVEAQLYAYYPGVEVIEEALDYTAEVAWDPEKWEMMVFHMGKKEDEIFPIKTYIDYGLDKLPKEEEKFEPMAAMIEQLGKAQPHERIWIQILAKPHAKKNFKTGSLSAKPTWEVRIQKKINELLGRDPKTRLGPGEYEQQPRLTVTERDTITAMERNMNKYAYETAIRWIYIAPKEKFNGEIISPTMRTFSLYDMIKRNGIGARWRTDFDYNLFSDPTGSRRLNYKRLELRDHKVRNYTMRDVKDEADKPKVMSVEELATIYHLPGTAVVSPALPRITSARKEAPSNLPVGMPVGVAT
jgi:hypothetical protein